jgi:hypothetical protein
MQMDGCGLGGYDRKLAEVDRSVTRVQCFGLCDWPGGSKDCVRPVKSLASASEPPVSATSDGYRPVLCADQNHDIC